MRTKILKSKKGQLFTILGIILIGLMFLSFEIYSYFQEREAIKTRVSTMNSFLNSIEKNLERQLYISGFRILFSAQNYTTSSGQYINVDEFFQEGFFNGTVNGVPNNILEGVTYDDIIESLNAKSAKINVNINMTNYSIKISQTDPWNIRFTMISDFVMEDAEGLARWEKRQNISALIPVQGFIDPLYTVGSSGSFSKIINRTIYEGNYVNGLDVSNLSKHFEGGYYAANPLAPSFLKRLEGDFSSDPNGIESFVRNKDVSSLATKANIDYIYFSPQNPPAHSVPGMPPWFEIDSIDNHTQQYGV